MALAGVLNLWALGRNGWANQYYAAAVRSMSTSWHDFLFASLDQRRRDDGGQAAAGAVGAGAVGARVRLPLAEHPRAAGADGRGERGAGVRPRAPPLRAGRRLRRRPGAGADADHGGDLPPQQPGLAADPVLRGGAVVRGARDRAAPAARARAGWWRRACAWGSASRRRCSWRWWSCRASWRRGCGSAPAARGRWHALRQLLAGGAAMLLVGGAWPLLVELTPAADRPWVSGTSNNTILSLIFEYNGLGRVDGQAGGPGGAGGGGSVFGGSTGPLRLLNSALGGQAGWLLGFALVSGLAHPRGQPPAPRGRAQRLAAGGGRRVRDDRRAVQLGERHLPPLLRVAAGAVRRRAGGRGRGAADSRAVQRRASSVRWRCWRASAASWSCCGDYPGQLHVAGAGADRGGRAGGARAAGVQLARRCAWRRSARRWRRCWWRPAVWALDTLGHATSGTFPAGGPTSAESGGFGGSAARAAASAASADAVASAGPRGPAGRWRSGPCGVGAAGGSSSGAGPGRLGARRRAAGGRSSRRAHGGIRGAAHATGACAGLPAPRGGGLRRRGAGRGGRRSGRRAASLTSVLSYVERARRRHDRGGQPVERGVGDHRRRRERGGHRRLLRARERRERVVAGAGGARRARSAGCWTNRTAASAAALRAADAAKPAWASKPAMAAVAKACAGGDAVRRTRLGHVGRLGGTSQRGGTLYDCQGRAAALASVSTQQSSS